PWALHFEHPGVYHRASRNIASSNHALRENLAVHALAGGRAPRRVVAESFLHGADGLHHCCEFIRLQTYLVIVARHSSIQGDMLLDDLCAARDGRDRNRISALVSRVTNDTAADLAEPIHVAQVDVLERRRI